MKRTDTIFKTITTAAVAMAITAGPAFGSIGYPSPSPNSWDSSVTAAEQTHSSVNATLNEPSQSVKSLTLGVGHSSVNASLNQPTPNVPSVGHSSVLASVNEPQPSSPSVGHSSVNASLNQPSPSFTNLTAGVGHSSLLASLNEPTSATPAGSSVSSIVGTRETAPVETATVVRDQSGFDWTDAFIGAMGALTLALLSVATVHTLRRRERMSLGSQV
jgi:hypothetical protein